MGQRNFYLNHRGLHLTEVLVTVAIISTLALVGSQSWIYYLRRAKVTNLKVQFAGIYTHQSNYYQHHEMFHPDFECIGYSPQGFVDYNVGSIGYCFSLYNNHSHQCNIGGNDRCTGVDHSPCKDAFSKICCHNRDDWINGVNNSTCKPHFTCAFSKTDFPTSGINGQMQLFFAGPRPGRIRSALYGDSSVVDTGNVCDLPLHDRPLYGARPEQYIYYGMISVNKKARPIYEGYDVWTMHFRGGIVTHVQSPY